MNLNEWAKEVNTNAVEHGWYDTERSFPEVIALMHSELSEALEEYRNGNPAVYYNCDGHVCDLLDCDECETRLERTDKPEGIAIELADCIIRILDTCHHMGFNIEEAVRIKHEYNKTRPYRHNGKVI
jgi:hypothetical protein